MQVQTNSNKLLCRVDLLIVALATLFFTSPAAAHTPHTCPPDLPDTPALTRHIEHADIVSGALSFDEVVAHGRALFTAQFNRCDGQGRPASTGTGEKRAPDEPAFIRTSAPEANSCAGCHHQPRLGGSGEFVANVFARAQSADPVTGSVMPDRSNERNTLGMFGAGAIDMLAREMSLELERIRDDAMARAEAGADGGTVRARLFAKGVDFGVFIAYGEKIVDTREIKGVDTDLIIKPFAQSGTVPSLRVFTVNTFNHHHGVQPEERFDLNKRKGPDFDEDGVPRELTIGDITAATLFQASLGVPGRVLPAEGQAQAAVARGEDLFTRPVGAAGAGGARGPTGRAGIGGGAGCASCHVPAMKLDSALFTDPYDENPIEGTFRDESQSVAFDMTSQGEGPHLEATADGGAIVRAYTDLKRHNLCDAEIRHYCNETFDDGRLAQDDTPGAHFFLTRKLWDVGSSGPYGHRGDLTTIAEAILAHGGEARQSRDAFVALDRQDQRAIVKFLKTLQILPPGSPRVVTEGTIDLATAGAAIHAGE